jgi:NAD+ synthase
MSNSLNIALAQINTIVGDLEGNYQKIKYYYLTAKDADLVIYPELAITGYPPEDLLLNSNFQEKSIEYINEIAKLTIDGRAIIVGGVSKDGEMLHNTGYFLHEGKINGLVFKRNLPNYGVFDEKRLFTSGPLSSIINFNGINLGILVCEDLWSKDVVSHYSDNGADLLIAINSSPFEKNKFLKRREIVQSHCRKFHLPIIYVNQVGGQDNVIFDGGSFCCQSNGELSLQMEFFIEQYSIINFKNNLFNDQYKEKTISLEEQIYQAAMLGVRDYVHKNGFDKVILGLSGGIDSALVAAICVDALGCENVNVVMMPSKYTSSQSLQDAALCALNLSIKLDHINIEPTKQTLEASFINEIGLNISGITEENLQSRIRGLILMAISNQNNFLVITTGNKSEMAVGYATLYGDMCGAYNPLKDIYKTEVFKLARFRNHHVPDNSIYLKLGVIPDNIINKAPSAELRENQTDQDSLPPYDILDDILYQLIEQNLSIETLIKQGYERKVVERISKLLYVAEYKRRQAAPGPKISTMSLGSDRRYPITSRWHNN